MAFKFTVDRSGCINCGICMDVCPVQALDMTRPNRAGPEGTDFGGETEPHRWMMQYPVQVSRCSRLSGLPERVPGGGDYYSKG